MGFERRRIRRTGRAIRGRVRTEWRQRRTPARDHGAAPVIAGIESEAEWQQHRADVLRALQPAGASEEELVKQIATLLWRQRRQGILLEYVRRRLEMGAHPENSGGVTVNRVHLERLEAYGAELDRLLASAFRRLHREQERRQCEVSPCGLFRLLAEKPLV
jgi:hypothetical protein